MEDMELWENALAKCKLFCGTITPLKTCYSALFKRLDESSIYLLYLDLNIHKVVEKRLDCTFVDRIKETNNNGTAAHITLGKVITSKNRYSTEGQTIYSIINSTGDTLIPFDEKCTNIWCMDNNFFLGYNPGIYGSSPSHIGLFQLDKCIDRIECINFPKFGKLGDIQIVIVYRRIYTSIKANNLATLYYIKGNRVISYTGEVDTVSITGEKDKILHFKGANTEAIHLDYTELSSIMEHLDCQSTFDMPALTLLQG